MSAEPNLTRYRMQFSIAFTIVLLLTSPLAASEESKPTAPEEPLLSSALFTTEFSAPNEFQNEAELYKWCDPKTFNLVLDLQKLEYGKFRVFVAYRMHTSGIFYLEPTVYLGLGDRSDTPIIKIAAFISSYRKGLNAKIRNGFLVIYQTNSKGAAVSEYGRFNLKLYLNQFVEKELP